MKGKWPCLGLTVGVDDLLTVLYLFSICKHKLRAIKRLQTLKMSSNGLAVSKVLEQIQMVQGMIDMNASSLNSLRTQFSTNSDLIQQEIRTLEVILN